MKTGIWQLVTARSSTRKDLAIIISYSGHTAEMITCAKAMKENQTTILAITRPVKSPISDLADLKLYTTSSESLFRSAAMASRSSSMNIIDILYTAFANMNYDHSLRHSGKHTLIKNSWKNRKAGIKPAFFSQPFQSPCRLQYS